MKWPGPDCPLCGFPLRLDRFGGHLAWCVYEVATTTKVSRDRPRHLWPGVKFTPLVGT